MNESNMNKTIIHFLFLLTSIHLVSSKNIREPFQHERNSENVEESEILKRVAVADRNSLWDDGVIPYEIKSNLSDGLKKTVLRAMNILESKSCMKFVPAEPTHNHRVIIQSTGKCGCCSLVGKRPKSQYIDLREETCNYVFDALHELMHTMGFHHEQNRPDRDKFVKVLYENIQEGKESQYHKLNENDVNTLGFSYDFDSIMHYSWYGFAYKGKKSMEVLNKNVTLNSKKIELSETDIAAVNKLYRCPECYVKLKQKIDRIDLSVNSLASKSGYCQWFYKGDPGEFIEFDVENLNIFESNECSSSYLQFQDGYLPTSPIIDRICGRQTKKYYKTGLNNLLITYKSSANSNNEEFLLKYRATCNGTIKGNYGRLQNPNYNEPCPFGPMCQWILMVPSGYQVALTFETFHIKRSENCQSDYLEIIFGNTDSGNKLLGRYCGDEIPNFILSSSNVIIVKYVSEKKSMENQFSANFIKEINECDLPDRGGCSDICINTIGSYRCECSKEHIWVDRTNTCEDIINTCGGTIQKNKTVVIASPSYPNPYPSNIDCTWTILENNFRLTFLLMDINESKNECSEQIILKNKSIKKVYCGSQRILELTLKHMPNMQIQFISKQNTNRRGFEALVQPL